jgi:hypothetical protein
MHKIRSNLVIKSKIDFPYLHNNPHHNAALTNMAHAGSYSPHCIGVGCDCDHDGRCSRCPNVGFCLRNVLSQLHLSISDLRRVSSKFDGSFYSCEAGYAGRCLRTFAFLKAYPPFAQLLDVEAPKDLLTLRRCLTVLFETMIFRASVREFKMSRKEPCPHDGRGAMDRKYCHQCTDCRLRFIQFVLNRDGDVSGSPDAQALIAAASDKLGDLIFTLDTSNGTAHSDVLPSAVLALYDAMVALTKCYADARAV